MLQRSFFMPFPRRLTVSRNFGIMKAEFAERGNPVMKKITVLLLTLSLLLSLTACGGQSAPTQPDADLQPQQEQQTPDPTPEPTPDDTQSPDNTQTGENTQKDGDGQQNTEAETFTRATLDGGVYTSDFFGLTADLSDGWLVADDSQLAQLAGMVSDNFDNEAVKDALEKGTTVFDLYAMRSADNATVNITVEDLGRLGGIMVTEDYYADMNVEGLPDAMAAGGITVKSAEKTTVEFAGASHPAVVLESTVGETALHQIIVFVKAGNYMACCTVACTDENASPADILALFRPVTD